MSLASFIIKRVDVNLKPNQSKKSGGPRSGRKLRRTSHGSPFQPSSKMSDTEGAQPKAVKRARTAYVQGPISPIAHPMAGKKLHKKIYKVVKKAADAKALKRGVKEVVKAVRKGDGEFDPC